MEVTKGQIISGVSRYVRREMLNKITDKPFKMTISAAINLLELRPDIADKILDSPLFMAQDGIYDLDTIEAVLTRTMDEYGDLPIKIPGIPFVSPAEKEFRFNADDVRKLRGYIVE